MNTLNKQQKNLKKEIERRSKEFKKFKDNTLKKIQLKHNQDIEPLQQKLDSIENDIVFADAKKLLSKKTMSKRLDLLEKLVNRLTHEQLSDDEFFDHELEQAVLFVKELKTDWIFEK